MPRRTPPSFDFYPDDFVGGTVHMTTKEVGAYMLWLCFQWGNNLLPNDPLRLARIARLSDAEFAEVWPVVGEKFSETECGGLVNERMQVVKEEQLARREARAAAGRKGGLSKAKAKLKQKGKQKGSKGKVEGGRWKVEGGRKKNGSFEPPTEDEVRAYCEERGNGVDPRKFVSFYESKGWKVGRQKMVDWRAAVRNWEPDNPPKQQAEEFTF